LSIILNPIVSSDLNDDVSISFIFSPTLTQLPYLWNDDPIIIDIDGTNGTATDIIYPNPPIFPGFEGTAGTNLVSLAYENEVIQWRTTEQINVLEWKDYVDNVIGDTDFLYFDKQFRYSFNNINWSDWNVLSIENLNTIKGYAAWFEFKYSCVALEDGFTFSLNVHNPKIGWNKVFDGSNFFQFDRDFPTQGSYKFILGGEVLPSNSILFGKTPLKANSTIEKGDYIFINSYFAGISLSDGDLLEIIYTERLLGNDYSKRIYLNELKFLATRNDEFTDTIFDLAKIGDRIILQPPFIIKVFKFTGYQISIIGETLTRTMDIQYRYSSNKKQWSLWTPLTQANFSTIKTNMLSFFYIEIAFTRTGTDTTGTIGLRDLIFEGDFQNITNDYAKMNKYGLRSDCLYNTDCECSSCSYGGNSDNIDSKCLTTFEEIKKEWANSCEPTYNPYNFNQPVDLYNKLANDVAKVYGWDVDYYKQDIDEAGVDNILHEYGTMSTTNKQRIKVLFPKNKIPDNIVKFNQFDLALFESIEIHITREVFHNAFGINERPAKKDILFFCLTNRWYRVESAQLSKNFMNSSVYYRVTLGKYEIDSGVNRSVYEEEIHNATIDNALQTLVGEQVQDEKNKITDKITQENSTEETVRLSIKAPISDYELENGPNIIATNYYSFINHTDAIAITYQRLDNYLIEGDNRCFTFWFNILELINGQYYNFIHNRRGSVGYKIGYKDSKLEIIINSNTYEFDISLSDETWYGLVVNLNQRMHKIEWGLYERYSSTQPGSSSSSELKLKTEGQVAYTPQTWDDPYLVMQIYGSPMLYTNLRVFSDVIQKDMHSKALNQYIIRDSSKLILADNANRKVISNSYKF
jgi:hypothetical protein